VKSGRSAEAVNVAEKAKEFFPNWWQAFSREFCRVQAAVSNCQKKSAAKSIEFWTSGLAPARVAAFAQAIPQARVTTVDFPEMTPITREFAEKFGVAARYDITRATSGRWIRTRCV